MAQGKKDNQNEEKKRSFVREHIVPRKNTKKIILTILSTIGLALLFGAIAGVAFFVSQDILDGNTVTQAPPTISISPDDHGPNNTDPFFPEQSSSVPERDSAESTTETKEAESSDLFPGGETSPDPDEGTSEGSGETDTK